MRCATGAEGANQHVKEDESELQDASTVALYILEHIYTKNWFKPFFKELHTAALTLKKTLYRIKVGHTTNFFFFASAFSCRTWTQKIVEIFFFHQSYIETKYRNHNMMEKHTKSVQSCQWQISQHYQMDCNNVLYRQRMDLIDFSDPLTFPISPTSNPSSIITIPFFIF